MYDTNHVSGFARWHRVDGRLTPDRLLLLEQIDRIVDSCLLDHPDIARIWRVAPRIVERAPGVDDLVALVMVLVRSGGTPPEPPWDFVQELGIRIAAGTWNVSVVVPDIRLPAPPAVSAA